MPRRNGISLKVLLLPLALLALIAAALGGRRGDEWDWEVEDPEPEQDVPLAAIVRSRRPSSRIAVAALFTTLFFAGASFTAGAGDQMAKALDDDAAALAEQAEIDAARTPAAAEAAAAPVAEPVAEPAADPVAAAPEAAAPEAAPVSEPVAEAPAEAAAPPAAAEETEVAPEPADEAFAPEAAAPEAATTPVTSAPAPKAAAKASPAAVKSQPTKKWVVKRAALAPPRPPEVEHDDDGMYGEPTVWLNRALPDPTPPSARLTRPFAKALVSAGKRYNADWAAVLGVLRAQGERGPAPATSAELDSLAARLAGGQAWRGALALSGRTGFADRAEALADLYRSVGIETLVTGYAASNDRLAKRLLEDPEVLLYTGGREDIAAGRIDVRVVVLLGYLAERHGSIAVSSLFSGHRKFARPGVVSAHVYGHAVDVAAIGGASIAGNQEPGGLTEAAVRSVLLLPSELQPQQVISLLGLGGPSFPMRDHGDHIHVGF